MEAAKMGAAAVPQINFPETTEWREFVFGPRPQRTLCRVVVWSILTVLFFHNLLVPIQIIGSSMYPTYRNGSLNLVNRWSYTKATPHRGDVVALQADGELLLKRIIAVPGETVSIVNGQIKVNNLPLSDEFSTARIPWEMDAVRLDSNEFFVIGDNRAASVFCKIEKEQILGKILF